MSIQDLQQLLLAYTLLLPRILCCFVVMPILSKQMLGGGLVRNGVACSLALFIYPAVAGTLPATLTGLELALVIGKEILLGLLIGLMAGVAAIVPYMGFIVGIGAALVAGLFQFGGDLYPMLGIVAVFMVGQALEGTVLTPLLVGDKIGMHPVAVIFAILAGGELFGFTGVLLALPVAAVIMVLVRHVQDLYKDSQVYKGSEDPQL